VTFLWLNPLILLQVARFWEGSFTVPEILMLLNTRIWWGRKATDLEYWSRLRQDSAVFWNPDSEPESKYVKKTDLYQESLFTLDSRSSMRGLYKCNCIITSIDELRVHRWFPKLVQRSDFQIWNNFLAGCAFKNFGSEAELESYPENGLRPPLVGGA